jgi:hypothetical protein
MRVEAGATSIVNSGSATLVFKLYKGIITYKFFAMS